MPNICYNNYLGKSSEIWAQIPLKRVFSGGKGVGSGFTLTPNPSPGGRGGVTQGMGVFGFETYGVSLVSSPSFLKNGLSESGVAATSQTFANGKRYLKLCRSIVRPRVLN